MVKQPNRAYLRRPGGRSGGRTAERLRRRSLGRPSGRLLGGRPGGRAVDPAVARGRSGRWVARSGGPAVGPAVARGPTGRKGGSASLFEAAEQAVGLSARRSLAVLAVGRAVAVRWDVDDR